MLRCRMRIPDTFADIKIAQESSLFIIARNGGAVDQMRTFTLRACKSHGPLRRMYATESHTRASPENVGLHLGSTEDTSKTWEKHARVRACCEQKEAISHST